MKAAWAACGAVLALPIAAALLGSTRAHTIALNLGPGDGPYVSGFAPEYEIEDKVGTHWTTYHADIRAPLVVGGGPLALTYRYARMFGQTAQVEVAFAGRAVDRFEARGGAVLERTVDVAVGDAIPVAVHFDVDSHERRDRGLRLDWVRVEAKGPTRVHLTGTARWRGAALVLIVLFVLRMAGWTPAWTALLAAPVATAVAAGLIVDPWLTHRMLRGVPEALFLTAALGLFVACALKDRVAPETVKTLAALCLLAFLIRTAAVNHPDFYYPDLRTHARLVQVLREAGLDFFVEPARYIWEHGVWRTEAYGRTYAFPYTPAFHLPFALVTISYDTLVAALKLAAVAVSLVPLVLVWTMARTMGASPLGAALMVAIPTYTSRLSYAFLPSLFGHAVDMAFIAWLIARLDRFPDRATFVRGALGLTACQLAYVSGVTQMSLFVLALALIEPRGSAPERARRGVLILALGALASIVSVVLYYRGFLGMVFDIVPRIGGAEHAVSRYEIRGFFSVAWERTRDFFDHVYPLLAVAGLWLLRGRKGYRVLLAWTATYFVLLLGRAKVPDVFLHGHETLLLTPLVCLAAGECLARLAGTGRAGRWAAAMTVVVLAGQGAVGQWNAVADQLANAL